MTLPLIGVDLLSLAFGRDLGAGLQPSWVLLALAILLQAASLRGRRGWLGGLSACGEGSGLSRRWTGVLAGAVLLSAAGIWIAPAPEPLSATLPRYGRQVVQLGVMAAFAAWPAWWTRGGTRWRWTARLIVLGACLQLAYAAAQGAAYYGLIPGWERAEAVFAANPSILAGSADLYLDDAMLHVPRLRGTACEPLYLGNFLLLAIPLVVLTGWRARALAPLTAGLLLLLLATWSRGAWLAAAAGAVILAWHLRRRERVRRWWRPLAGACLLLAAFCAGAAWLWPDSAAALPWRRLVQTFSTRDWSNLTRLYSMQAAWRGFLASPLVGLGWGQFGWHFPLLVDAQGLQSQFTWPVVNNLPLLILAETGLVGFAAAAAAAAVLARRVVRALATGWRPQAETRLRLALVWGALAAIGIQMLTFSQYNLPHIWVALGLTLAAAQEAGADGGGARAGGGGRS